MRYSEKAIFANMCMVCSDDRVLILNRVDPEWPGVTFPGGHVEQGESFTDAVIREAFEETGLKISSPRLCGVKNWFEESGERYVVFFYKTDKFSGELCSSEEGEVSWVTVDELKHLNLAKDMPDMLKVFLDDDLSEFWYYKQGGEWQNNEWKYELK